MNESVEVGVRYSCEIRPEYVPVGDSTEDIELRRKIISRFYHDWKLRNQSQRKFNLSLNEYINIRFVSITETCTHASRNYLSQLWKYKRMPLWHPYDLPQDCTGDVYLAVGLGARALH